MYNQDGAFGIELQGRRRVCGSFEIFLPTQLCPPALHYIGKEPEHGEICGVGELVVELAPLTFGRRRLMISFISVLRCSELPTS